MWVMTPTFSLTLQKASRALETRSWGKGIYFLADIDRTAVVVIHQLPKTIDTLFLRLLGRGRVQAEAIAELIALPSDHPYRSETLHHISRLQINLKLRQNKTKDLREIIMNLAPAYDKWLEETLEQGREQGVAIGRDEGLAIGREESKVEIAQQLFQINLPIETIAQVTGLSIEFLEKLPSNP